MSPEEAYVISRRIASLKKVGEGVKSALEGPELDPDDGDDARLIEYKREGWLGEVEALIKNNFGNIPSFLVRFKEINEGQFTKVYQATQILDLLNTMEGFIFIDSQTSASEPLKGLIEQTLKERYFSSWEVRVLAGLFAFAVACLFGGTIYLGFQVQGVANQAEAARKSIASERDSIAAIGTEAISRIEANANKQAQAQIAKLNEALESATKSIANLNTEVGNKTTAIGQTFVDGQKAIKTATNDAIDKVPSAAASSLTSKIDEITSAARQNTSKKVDEADKQIQDNVKSFNIRKQNFEDALPDVTKYTENRVKEFNDIVSRYQGRIDEVLSRFSGSEKLTALEVVSRVLGSALWFMVVTAGLSVFAFLLAIAAFVRARRTSAV